MTPFFACFQPLLDRADVGFQLVFALALGACCGALLFELILDASHIDRTFLKLFFRCGEAATGFFDGFHITLLLFQKCSDLPLGLLE